MDITQSLFTHNPDGVFSLDLEGYFSSANLATTTLTGLAPDDLIGIHYSRFVEPEYQACTDEAYARAKLGEPVRYETQIVDARGERHVLDVTNIPMMLDEQVVGVYGIAKDITHRKQQETRLHILQRSIEVSLNGIVIVDAQAPDLPVLYANPPFLRITGYDMEEVMGHNCRFLQGPDTDPQTVAKLRHGIEHHREVRVTLRNYHKEGTPFWNDLYISPIRDGNGCVTHFVGVMHDISEHKTNEARLAYYASHDALTGLPHRTLLEERLAHDYQLTLRNASLLAVLYIDLDDFKPINDSLGFGVGDKTLKVVARRLESLITPGDTLARVGGNEFVMLLPGLNDEDQVWGMAERALTLLATPYVIGTDEIYMTASIGIATNQEAVKQPVELIRRADMAMHHAKRMGRNTYHWFTHDTTGSTMNERVVLRRELHEAIQQQQFTLYYQPLVAAESGQTIGFEALIRWQHPVHGVISPAVFIPLAEQTGQIIKIGQWVMEQACHDLAMINASLGSDYTVAINISPLQFRRDGFLASIRQALEATNLAPHLLEIEITEGVLMEHTEAAVETLHSLRNMGMCVALDDFGTGFSSLSYLRRLPIKKVKIDRSFVKDVTTRRHDAAIAQGVITMSHHLDLQVVAEGIETQEQLNFLTEQKCDLFQGYLLARPMPLEKLKEYLHLNAQSPPAPPA